MAALFTSANGDLLLEFAEFLPEGVRQAAMERIQRGEGLEGEEKVKSVFYGSNMLNGATGPVCMSALDVNAAVPISISNAQIMQQLRDQQQIQHANSVTPRAASHGTKKRPRSSVASTQQIQTNPNQPQIHSAKWNPFPVYNTTVEEYKHSYQQQQQPFGAPPPIVSLLTAHSTPLVPAAEKLHHSLPPIPRKGVLGTPEEEARKARAFDLVFRIRQRLAGEPETYRWVL
jgi:hypothetical protein